MGLGVLPCSGRVLDFSGQQGRQARPWGGGTRVLQEIDAVLGSRFEPNVDDIRLYCWACVFLVVGGCWTAGVNKAGKQGLGGGWRGGRGVLERRLMQCCSRFEPNVDDIPKLVSGGVGGGVLSLRLSRAGFCGGECACCDIQYPEQGYTATPCTGDSISNSTVQNSAFHTPILPPPPRPPPGLPQRL